MAKGKKKDKKPKKDKKGKEKAVESDDEPDPNVICSQGEFTLPNEDVYNGEFCAHKQGLIWREGHGVYTTKDGQEYEGLWHNDKLREGSPVEIRYPEGHTFVGLLTKDKYNGPGTYYCSDVKISCNFENNKPQGRLVLIDPKGEVYYGDARDVNATLLPANVLFDNINPSRGIMYEPGTLVDMLDVESGITCLLSDVAAVEPQHSQEMTWEKIIFAKSKKTDTRMNFADSDWYKDWLNFKKHKQRIESGLPSNDEQSHVSSIADEQWLQEYEMYKRLRQEANKTSSASKIGTMNNDWMSVFHSTAYANSCPAVRVVYPSNNLDTSNSLANYVPDALPRDNGENIVRNASVTFSQFLKCIEENPKTPGIEIGRRNKCLNKRHFGGDTTSMFQLVNNFFDNKTTCTMNRRSSQFMKDKG